MTLVDDERPGEEEERGKVGILRDRQETAKGRTCEEKRETRQTQSRRRGELDKRGGQYTTEWQRCNGTYL